MDRSIESDAQPVDLLGLLNVKVLRGVDLAVRDARSSDPYVLLRLPGQKLRTRVIWRNLNPVWEEELTLAIHDPSIPLRLEVYDKDLLTCDDPMGCAVLDIQPLFEAVKLDLSGHGGIPDGTIVMKLVPSRLNCLAEESPVYYFAGTIKQDVVLRLRDVERGEIELQLSWIDVPPNAVRRRRTSRKQDPSRPL